MTGLTKKVLEEHLRSHVVEATDDASREKGAEDMIQILKSYFK
jgi:DNA-binding FrmR family transcriptional regulator